jgi:hypothetical protein
MGLNWERQWVSVRILGTKKASQPSREAFFTEAGSLEDSLGSEVAWPEIGIRQTTDGHSFGAGGVNKATRT